MNVFGFGFLILVSLIGGLIAIFADNLGRTLGKKRLSLMKLRPRKTAQVITFVAGAVIPLLSIGAVMWLSEGVRRWFVEGPRVIDERDRALGDIKRLSLEINQNENRIKDQTRNITQKERELGSVGERLAKAQETLKNYSDQIASLTSQVKRASARLASLQGQVQRLTVDYQAVHGRLLRTQEDLKGKEQERENLEKSFQLLTANIKERDDYAHDLQEEIEKLESDKRQASGEIERLKGQMSTLELQNASAQAQYEKDLGAKQRELELAALELDRRRGELRQAEEQLQAVRDIWGNSRTQDFAFRIGEEVARITVPAGMNRQDAQNQLTRLLRTARSEAENHGAKGRTGTPAAGIVERFVDGKLLTSDMQQQRIVDRLTGLSDPLVLVATSSLNAFKGEPVSLEIQSFRNGLIFEQGELVAETRIDGDRSEEVLLDQIEEFLEKSIQAKANESGMVPRLGPKPLFPVPTYSEILALIRTAKSNSRRVRLMAFAPKDIRAGDPLILDYRIR